MARAKREDRGLKLYKNAAGEERWRVRLYHQGKAHQFEGFTTKTEARNFYDDRKKEQREQRFFPEQFHARQQPAPVLFSEYLETWLKNQHLKGKKEATIKAYEWRLRLRALPVFGSLELPAITRRMVKNWIAKLSAEGLAYETLLGYLCALSGLFSEAVEDGHLTVNPATKPGKILKRPPALENGELEIFTPAEEAAILRTARDQMPPVYPLVLTLFRTGARIGEVLALHRSDLDFRTRTLTIRRNWSRWRLGTPKNGKTRRVGMSQELARALEAWCETQALEAQAAGRPPSEIVFLGNVGGTRRKPSYMAENWVRYKLWFPLLEQAQVRRLTPHATRHTFASRLLAYGEPIKFVSEALGHSSSTVTAGIYEHWIPGANKQAVDRLDVLPTEEATAGAFHPIPTPEPRPTP